jgi:hypothetical protein
VAVLLLRGGNTDRLAAVADELEAVIREPTGEDRRSMAYAVARVRVALGQRERALALVTLLADEGLPGPVKTAIELGEIELAERFAALASGIARALYDATIAEARGDFEAAAGGYAQVADYHRPRGEVVHILEPLLGLGRVRTRLGRTAEAADALNEARPILVKLGASPLLAETDALLEQLTARSA